MANTNESDKNFKKVRFYQDKIVLETELNEVQDVQNRRFEDFVYDAIGNCVVSGLDVSAVTATWNVSVNTGKSYTNGKIITSQGGADEISIVDPGTYAGDLTLYIIARPVEPVYLPDAEGDKGWEYGVGEPTTYRTEESYEIVVAQEGSAIIVGATTYAEELPSDPLLYVELARILRPNTASDIDDCTIRDTRPHLLNRLAEIVNKVVYEKAEQQYDDIGDMASASTLLITPGTNTADERDRIGTSLSVTPSELSSLDGSKIWDTNGDLITVSTIVTQDIDGETLPEATVTLSGDVAEKVYAPIVGASNLLLAKNYDFENGTGTPDDWTSSGSPLFSEDGSESYTGNNAVRVSDGNSYTMTASIAVSAESPYQIGAYIKAVSSLTYQFKADWYTAGDVYISSSTVDVTTTTSYANYTAIVTSPASAVKMKLVLNGDGSSGTNYFWVDHVDVLLVTESDQFPVIIHYGYEYTLANLPANFAMADISSGVTIDMAIQEILGNRYFDGTLVIGPDGTNSVDRRIIEMYDELHTHRHKGIVAPKIEARDVTLLNPPGTTTETNVEDHITTIGNGSPDDNNPHGMSSQDVNIIPTETPYTMTPGFGAEVSIADHISEVGTGIPDVDNPHGLDSTDIEHNAETLPNGDFKTIEAALFDRVKDLSGDGVVRGFRLMPDEPEDNNGILATNGYAYVNGKRIRSGDSVIIMSVTADTTTSKTFRISGALVSDTIYISYFGNHTYYRWAATAFDDSGILKITINDGNLAYNYDGVDIVNYENLIWDNNERFDAQKLATYTALPIDALGGVNDRIDIVVLGDNGTLSVVKGGETGARIKPLTPNNSIKIGEVYVNYDTGTDIISYDDVGDYRFRIDWKHSGGGGSSGSGEFPNSGSQEADELSTWKRLQLLDTTVEYYRQLFVSSADTGLSLSQMAIETFMDYSHMDEGNSSNVQVDDENVYLGANEIPIQSSDLVADWRSFPSGGGTGTWVSNSYVDQHAIGVVNIISAENPTFEAGVGNPDNWTASGSPVFDVSGTNSYAGSNAVKVSFGNSYTMTNFVAAAAGTSYKMSAFIKAVDTTVDYELKVLWFTAADAPNSSSTVTVTTSNSRYDEYEGVVVAPASTAKMKVVLDGDGSSALNEFWIDNVAIVELSNIPDVLLFVRETMNGGGNEVKYYLTNDGSVPIVPTDEVTPNALYTFPGTGSQLRVKIEVIPDNNSGETQPRVHSFSLIWGIGQGHNHNGENSTNTLGEDPAVDDLSVIGNLNLTDDENNVPDVAALLTYLTPPAPPVIGEEQTGNGADPTDNGPNDMRQIWGNFGFISGYIPGDAYLLSGSTITPGTSHNGVTNLDNAEIDVFGFIYPADSGYLEATITDDAGTQVIASLNLTNVWGDVVYTDSSPSKVNVSPRASTEQTDYLIGGAHGNIDLTERMTYFPTQTSLPFPYYQTARYSFKFNPYDYQNSNSDFGEEELGIIEIKHYTSPAKTTLIGSATAQSLFNDVG